MTKPETQPGTRELRRARKLKRVLACARRMLRSAGFDALSLRQVAREAEISPAGMYEIFASKEALLRAVAEQVSVALARALRVAQEASATPAEAVIEVGKAYVAFAQRHPQDFLLLFSRRAERDSLSEDVPADSPYGILRAVARAVLDPQEVANASGPVLEGFAYGYWSTVHGMAMLALTALAGFPADFEGAAGLVLGQIAASWVSWHPSAASACNASGGGNTGGKSGHA